MQFNVLRSVTSSIIWRFKIHSNQFVTKSQHTVYFCPKKFQSAKQKSISHFFCACVTPNLKIASKETLIASFLYYFITFQWNFAHAIGQLFKLSFRMNVFFKCNYFSFPASIYLLKVNNRSTRTRCGKCSKLTIKIPERRLLVALLLTVNIFHTVF